MSALLNLASLLTPAVEEGSRPMSSHDGIDTVIAKIMAQTKGRSAGKVPEDIQLDAVQRFWHSQEVQGFRDAYLLSWGLCLPHRPQGDCILEDQPRLQRVLDGVDDWQIRPSAFRRCYQGLLKSYFTYDAFAESSPAAGRNNWKILRNYLKKNVSFIHDTRLNPDWVETAQGNQQLLGERPCEPYVESLLRGDSSAIDRLCAHLGIDKASWFLRELVLAQVNKATQLPDSHFQPLLPRLLDLLAANEVLRDRGLILVLDRYARIEGVPLHQGLRNNAVNWWGNPWLPSNETRWGGVQPEARAMVSDWLKLEFIETFFTKLAEDGLGDPRRLNFWKRYINAINHIEFALGTDAYYSNKPDYKVLRDKAKGLICKLQDGDANNAFIMHIGSLVVVEFSQMNNATYGYEGQRGLPFNTKRSLTTHSLKDRGSAVLRLIHRQAWEHEFESTLENDFGISPLAERNSTPIATPTAIATNAQWMQPYSRAALDQLSRAHGIRVEDLTEKGGNLWVRTDNIRKPINDKLSHWGFQYRLGKGWWK